MGDERIPWREVDPTPVGIETDEVVAVDVTAPPPVGGSERIEVLRIRWDTPRGRKVRSAVIRDIRFEGSKHLSEILAELRGAGEVPKFLDLRYVRLDSENLNGTNLSGADLTGADLSKTTLVSANLRQARLVRARLVGATLRDADLSRADLSEANLTEACLDGTVQVSSVLARSRCIGASFRGASLVGADLRGAMLVRAVFERADLGGAEVGGAHALARAFETSTQRPNGIADVNEVPLSAPTVVLPRGPLDVARLERTPTGSFKEPPREKRPTGQLSAQAVAEACAPAAEAAARSWDSAIAALIPMRGRVSRIVIEVEGEERVIFQR